MNQQPQRCFAFHAMIISMPANRYLDMNGWIYGEIGRKIDRWSREMSERGDMAFLEVP